MMIHILSIVGILSLYESSNFSRGKGTRLSEYTKSIPKPMVKIGSKPIIEHIINYYKNLVSKILLLLLVISIQLLEIILKINK